MGEIRGVHTSDAPDAIGPYRQAVAVDGWLYVSGQIPLDPASGELVQGDVTVQTQRALDNLQAIVEAAGGSLERVVRTTIYLADMGDFSSVNEVYARYFGGHKPARTTIQAGGLPKGVSVEVDAIARLEG